MKFSDDILKRIKSLGSDGYSIHRIANELNITYDELLYECSVNGKLKDAIDRAQLNYEQFTISRIELLPESQTQRIIYERLISKHNKGNDNKIEIEYV